MCQVDKMILFIYLLVLPLKASSQDAKDTDWYDPANDDSSFSCSNPNTFYQKIICSADSLPPLSLSARTPFSRCLLVCAKLPTGQQKEDCTSKCNDLSNPSESSQECLLGCATIGDPAHQAQCIDKCRSSARINATRDFANTCETCSALMKAIRTKLPKGNDLEEIKTAFLKACPANINLLPICQGIGAIGADRFAEMLVRETDLVSDAEICHQMKLCE